MVRFDASGNRFPQLSITIFPIRLSVGQWGASRLTHINYCATLKTILACSKSSKVIGDTISYTIVCRKKRKYARYTRLIISNIESCNAHHLKQSNNVTSSIQRLLLESASPSRHLLQHENSPLFCHANKASS